LSSSSSESIESGRSVGRRIKEESTSLVVVVGRILMETVTEVREDPPEEIAESNWPAKAGYEWIAADVRNQSSLFRWSHLLNSWLNCTRDGNGPGWARIVPTRNPTRQKKICSLPARLPAGYPLKKYPRVPVDTRYPPIFKKICVL